MSRRTTLTLDDDVAASIEAEVRRTGRPHRAVVNDAIRRGLEATSSGIPPAMLPTRPMGLRPGFEIDDIAGLVDRLDGPVAR